jgi:hypothetical protein
VSCIATSKEAFASTTPVTPPTVNKATNPKAKSIATEKVIFPPYSVANHLKILIPVGTAMTMVAAVKYARVSTSKPTTNMW